jgi:hypothetical protein
MDEVAFVEVEVKGITEERRPQWCPQDQRPICSENGQRDVFQSRDESVYTWGNVGGNASGGRREKAADPVQVVSFKRIEPQSTG